MKCGTTNVNYSDESLIANFWTIPYADREEIRLGRNIIF
jgi:hypothetical protein